MIPWAWRTSASASFSKDDLWAWGPGALPAGVGCPKPPARSGGPPPPSQLDSQAQSWWSPPWLRRGESSLGTLARRSGPLCPVHWESVGGGGYSCAPSSLEVRCLTLLLPRPLSGSFPPSPSTQSPSVPCPTAQIVRPGGPRGISETCVKPSPYFTDEDTCLGRIRAPHPESHWGLATELVSLP